MAARTGAQNNDNIMVGYISRQGAIVSREETWHRADVVNFDMRLDR